MEKQQSDTRTSQVSIESGRNCHRDEKPSTAAILKVRCVCVLLVRTFFFGLITEDRVLLAFAVHGGWWENCLENPTHLPGYIWAHKRDSTTNVKSIVYAYAFSNFFFQSPGRTLTRMKTHDYKVLDFMSSTNWWVGMVGNEVTRINQS